MEKLKSRLDAFADGIMAVIITIMVLDISPVLHDSWPNYLSMSEHIGIYLITFVFVFNMWYQHSTVFAEIDTMTYRILIWEVFFLGLLSLMPLFTDMMAENTTRITVILYGVSQAIISLVFRSLAKAIIHLQYTAKEDMQKVYQKIYGNANRWLDLLSGLAIIIGYFIPRVALLFFLAYPILSFLLNADARQQMYDAEALPDDEQKDLADMPASAYVDWRKAAKQMRGNNNQANGRQTTTAKPAPATANRNVNSEQAARRPANSAPVDTPTDDGRFAAPNATQSGVQRQPNAPTGNWTGGLPGNLDHWLNQTVDTDRQRLIAERFQNATPEQRQRMEEWFKKRRQMMKNHNQRANDHAARHNSHGDGNQQRTRQDVTQAADTIAQPEPKSIQNKDNENKKD